MKGRVKMFNEEKGYGFILGDDANDYFVHITEVKSVETLTRGTIVEFEPAETERGKVAKAVVPSGSVSKKPAFVEFGNTRIKLNNIKNYGISSVPTYYAIIFEKEEKEQEKATLFGLISEKTFEWVDTGEYIRLSESREEAEELMEKWSSPSKPRVYASAAEYRKCHLSIKRYVRENDRVLDYASAAHFDDVVICRPVEYLYVTTFQNDNYRFATDLVDFDIHKKCKELDAYMF